MVELSAAPEEIKQRIEQLGTVDLVIGLVDQKAIESIENTTDIIRRGLTALSQSVNTVVVLRRDSTAATTPVLPEGLENESLRLATYALPPLDTSVTGIQTLAAAARAIWNVSERLNARACVVILSVIDTLTPEWIERLAQPVFEQNFDLVAPLYAPHRFQGLLNSAVLYPLMRALYGKRIENPLGPDLGMSARLCQSVLQIDSVRARSGQPFAPVGPVAAARGFKVCQAYIGERVYPPVDWKNVDSLLSEVLGPVFLAIEQDAPYWQHIRNSEPVPTYGNAAPAFVEENVAVDTRRLLDPFRLGFRNLQEIWSLVLPPSALLELKKADRLPPEQFQIPDEVWARAVYDFVLAYRLRTIARDHLLRAMTPLYLGWLASYFLGLEAKNTSLSSRLEPLCTAYERAKPYFVSRWRWPDRFNP